MSTNITTRLSQLRREKGLSQKEAAAGLGVSQALLSHYENGIRECGLDFLCRAADYYNVTTDFILGRSESKRGFEGAFGIQTDISSDSELNTLTIFRVANKLRKYMSFKQESRDSSIDSLHRIYSLMMYRVIIAETAKGNLPKDWLPNVDTLDTDAYMNILDCTEATLIKSEYTTPRPHPNKIPLCLKTLISQTQHFISKYCAESEISLSDKFLTKF